MLQVRPFHPLVFRFSDGQTEIVHHPEMVIVGYDFLQFGIPHDENPRLAASTKRFNTQNLVSVEREGVGSGAA